MSKLKLLDYFQLFEGGAPHHLAAVSILEESMPDELLDHFAIMKIKTDQKIGFKSIPKSNC